jgi:hypothetical protein
MRFVKLLAIGGMVALGLLVLLPQQPAEAQIGCCRVRANGTVAPPSPGNTGVCSQSALVTKRLGVGRYQVDFTPVTTDARPFLRIATLDTQSTAATTGQISVEDRTGVPSAVFVRTTNSAGTETDKAFNLCIAGY